MQDLGLATAAAERDSRSGNALPRARRVMPATFSFMPSILESDTRFGQLYLTVEDIQQMRTQSQTSRMRTAAQVWLLSVQYGSSM